MASDPRIAASIDANLLRRPTDSPEIAQRLSEVAATVAENLQVINERSKHRLPRLNAMVHEVVERHLPPVVKYARLWKMADELVATRVGHEACAKGCSHCCHIAVPITRIEAQLVGSRIGRAPAPLQPNEDRPPVVPGYHNPCPFLRGGMCSIYAHRPLVCRNQANLDRDDLLCRLTKAPVSVPYFRCDTFTDLEMQISAEAGDAMVADIRHWFPAKDG